MDSLELKYLNRLAEKYPSIAMASTEIINLQSILNLPKGTEHFLTDIHGEYEAFSHVLKNGSGSVRRKIDEIFGHTLSTEDKQTLATLIYYPKEKMDILLKKQSNVNEWYKLTLYRLIEVCKTVSSKYTRSKVRKSLPSDFAYVIEELITEKAEIQDKESYYNSIVHAIIETGRAKAFIIAMSELIQRLVIDQLHIVGDIYDRGPGPQIIMDQLMTYHSVDIQWGNHDVLWMGAAAGQQACIANVIRICARYGNLDILEDGYGINLLPLASYAMNHYNDDPCSCFTLKGESYENQESKINLMIHKAITILQFKIEGNIIHARPDFELENRNLLHLINYKDNTITIDGKIYTMKDTSFPTVDSANPYTLTNEELDIMSRLESAFLHCEKLQQHVRFLLSNGGLYKVCNGNLLYHGCVLLDATGSFKEITLLGNTYTGKDWYDFLDSSIRKGFFSTDLDEVDFGRDLMWYIWLHPNSPLFGKDKMATFERHFIDDKELHKESKNPYYYKLDDCSVINMIMEHFQLDASNAHIINGHVPVKSIDGESPIKCNGKVLVIDGGFSKAYQKQTGIAGYTLISNSYGLRLAAHKPFLSTEDAIENESDIVSENLIVQRVITRKLVGDTDIGMNIKENIADLQKLLHAYRSGLIKEKS
ncbi:MAG: fructose-1,6-bisphosphatase [Eubacteriales bacterium]